MHASYIPSMYIIMNSVEMGRYQYLRGKNEENIDKVGCNHDD